MSAANQIFRAANRRGLRRIALAAALMLGSPLPGHAQTDVGSLPRVSAPGAYGDAVSTGVAASSSTARALAPPPGLGSSVEPGLTLNIGVGAAWHSNPERRDDDFESDAALLFSPSIGYAGEIGRHQYQVEYGAGSESYDEFEVEDSDYERLGGALRLDLTRILVADLYASRLESEEERGSAGSRPVPFTEDEDEYTMDTLGGRVTLGRRTNRLQIFVGAEATEVDFTNNDQGNRDRDEDRIEGGLFFNVGASTALFLHASQLDIDYLAGNPSLDSTERYLTAGVAWEASEAVSLSIEAGQLEKEYDDPTIAGYDGSTYLGKILWNPRDRTSVSLYASRATEESADPDAAFYVSDVMGVDVTQQLGERASVTVHYAYAEDDYSNGRQDEIDDYGIAFGYAALSWLDLGLGYNVVERESSEPGEDYQDEIWSIFANFKPNLGGNR